MSAFKISLLLAFVSIALCSGCKTASKPSKTPTMAQFTYVDAMSNQYHIGPDFLKYEPIKPALSSSGMADGGEPKQVALEATVFSDLSQWFEKLILDQSMQLASRNMGCGTVIDLRKKPSTTYFISPKSNHRTELEQMLRDLLK
jgi:hypothetical protein